MDPSQIIESILNILSAKRDAEPQAVEKVNLQLAEALAPVNARLRRCDKMLHEGKRTQAIEVCDQEPQLLDLVALLDFPERSVWDDYVAQFHLTPAPPLLADVAADLNEAYTAQMSVHGILDQFRLHSLARSPLSTRLGILRQLVTKDPNNIPWQQDLQEYERARLAEIKTQVEAAVARQDLAVLAEVDRELTETPWGGGRPSKLMDYVARAHSETRRTQAREQLTALAEQLITLFGEFNIDAARPLRGQWNSIANVVALPQSDPLYEYAAPALQWIEEYDRRDAQEVEAQQALDGLNAAIYGGTPRSDLERLHQQAARIQEIPHALQSSYEARLRQIDSVAKRKTLILVASVLVACITLAGSLFAFLRHSGNMRHKSTLVTILDEHLKAGSLQAARDDVKNCERDSAWVFRTAEYQKLVADLSTEEKKDEDIQRNIAEILKPVRESAIPAPTWENLDEAFENVFRAKEIAVGRPGLLAEIEAMENDLERKKKDLQETANREFRLKLDAMEAEEESLSVTEMTLISQAFEQAQALRKEKRFDQNLDKRIDQLIDSLEKRKVTASEGLEEEKLFQSMTKSVGNSQEFESALKMYLTRFPSPSRPRSVQFQKTLDEDPSLWREVKRWNDFCDHWMDLKPYQATTQEARKFTIEAHSLIDKSPAFPTPEEFRRVVEYLDAVGSQTFEDEKILFNKLVKHWNGDLYGRIYAIQTKSERFYYGPKAPVFKDQTGTFKYYTDTSFKTTKSLTMNKAEMQHSAGEGGTLWEASQWKVTRDLSDRLKEVTPQTWEQATEEAVLKVLDDDSLDPILKMTIASDILEIASEGSVTVREAFAAALPVMKKSVDEEEIGLMWLDPEDGKGKDARRNIAETWKNLDIKQRFQELKGISRTLDEGNWRVEYQWVGWLVRKSKSIQTEVEKEDGDWECRFKLPLDSTASGSLVTIRTESPDRWKFEPIGQVTRGQHALQDEEHAGFVEGRPVYLVVQRNDRR